MLFYYYRAVEKGGGGGGGGGEQNRKTEHFYMWITFETLFIKKDISDKNYIAFSEFVVLAVNWATAVTNNEFVSFLFLIETFVKTNSNLMCGSF